MDNPIDWDFVKAHWTGIIMILKSRLDTNAHKAFDSNGVWIKTGRPMIEDIHETKVHKHRRFRFYLDVALAPGPEPGPMNHQDQIEVEVQRQGNEVHLNVTQDLNLRGSM